MTLGDIYTTLAFILGFITTITGICVFFSKQLSKALNKSLEPTNKKLDDLSQSIKQVDIDNTKNYLQQALTAVDNGSKLEGVARERFFENYDHYTNDLHMNSWVHAEKERLEKEGKL